MTKDKPTLELKVRVIEGKDLLAADSNGFSDPYVEIKGNEKLKHKTKTINKTLNPVWNDEFEFMLSSVTRLDFKVFDHDALTSDDHIGTCFLDLSTVPKGVWTDFWLPLPTKGQLHVSVNPVNFVPAEHLTPGYMKISGPLVFPTERIFRAKQQAFSTHMNITDQDGTPVFDVVPKIFSWGQQIKITDMSKTGVVFIKQTGFILGEFEVFYGANGGACICHLDKKFTWFAPKFKLQLMDPNAPPIDIEGDWLALEYSFKCNGVEIANVSRKFFSLLDTYGIRIMAGVDASVILACCIIFDKVVTDHRKDNRQII